MRWVLIAATAFAVLLHVALMGFEEQCARQEIQRLHRRVRLAEQLRSVERARYQATIFRAYNGSLVRMGQVEVSAPESEGEAPPELAAGRVSW